MRKINFKKVEFQINDEYASNFLCGENLLSYVKLNLSIDGNYVLVVKYISLYHNVFFNSIVLKSNKILDYSFLSSEYDRLIIGLKDIVSMVGFSEKELERLMKNKLVQEELLFSIMKYRVLKDYCEDDNYCYDYGYGYDYDYDYNYYNLDINYDNLTMYFIPVDNYTGEVLDNIINRFDV